MKGSWKGRGNQYIQFVRVLYCQLPTNGKQLPAFPLKTMLGIEPRPQRWEVRVLPLCHRGPLSFLGTQHLRECLCSHQQQDVSRFSNTKVKVVVCIPFNSKGHVGTGPHLCHL